ncbi:MAG: molybdenum cofactor biosynthesis protein B [Pseudomonadales bacterium]
MKIAVLTVSDTRTAETDTSGSALQTMIEAAGHQVVARDIVRDNIYAIRAIVSKWIFDEDVQAVITTGGTGFTGRDSTPEALIPLFDKQMDGFGELFRQLSYDDIGTSTIQSRAVGGLANATVIFALPGSTGAVRLGWEKIIRPQLDINNKPCNFAELAPRFRETARS